MKYFFILFTNMPRRKMNRTLEEKKKF